MAERRITAITLYLLAHLSWGLAAVCNGTNKVSYNGRTYTVVEELATSELCRGKKLQSSDGRFFCIAKNPDPQNSSMLSCAKDTADYSECGLFNPPSQNRLLGGKALKDERLFPWMVYIAPGCTGSIISPRAILTAAHCLKRNSTDFYVIAGSNSKNDSRYNYTVKAVIPHPDYKVQKLFEPTGSDFDIGLVITEREIEFSERASPICLPKKGETFANKPATVGGWGQSDHLSAPILKAGILRTKQLNLIEIFSIFSANNGTGVIVHTFEKTMEELFPDFRNIYDEKTNCMKNVTNAEILKMIGDNLQNFKKDKNLFTDSAGEREFTFMYEQFFQSLTFIGCLNFTSLPKLLEQAEQIRRAGVIMLEYARYAEGVVMPEEDCKSALNQSIFPNLKYNCVNPKTKGKNLGFPCMGDSGSSAAVMVDGRYVIVGVYSLVNIDGFPVGCWCDCKMRSGDYFPHFYWPAETTLDWIYRTLQMYGALPEKKRE